LCFEQKYANVCLMSIHEITGYNILDSAADLETRHPGIVFVGSLGRAAIMGEPIESFKPSGVPRDMDVFRPGERLSEIPNPDDVVDTIFESWITAGGTHLVFPHDPNLQVEVRDPEEVFKTYKRKIGDVALPTLHPDVQSAISTMQYIQRPKDKVAAAKYDAFLATQADRLHPELLEPFVEFRSVLSQRTGYRAAGAIRNVYQRAVPETTRSQLHLGRKVGWLRSR
jgi:hypothetical protein